MWRSTSRSRGGELVELWVDAGGEVTAERVEDESGEARGEDGVPAVHPADGVGQLGGGRWTW